jgi:hypothetical protein
VFLKGTPHNHGHLVLTDDAGHRTGFVDGDVINQIPGARVDERLDGGGADPTYHIPAGTHFTVTIDGTQLKTDDPATGVDILGPGFNVSVEQIDLKPGQQQKLDPAADGTKIAYTSPDAQSPQIEIGGNYPEGSFGFTVTAKADAAGTITAQLPIDTGKFSLQESKPGANVDFSFIAQRQVHKQTDLYGTDSTKLAPGDTASLDYSSWKTGGKLDQFTITHAP